MSFEPTEPYLHDQDSWLPDHLKNKALFVRVLHGWDEQKSNWAKRPVGSYKDDNKPYALDRPGIVLDSKRHGLVVIDRDRPPAERLQNVKTNE